MFAPAQPKVIAEFVYKKTPLIMAAERGNLAAVKFLLQYGLADLEAVDVDGRDAVQHAWRFPAIQRLLRGAKFKQTGRGLSREKV